ncbi:hypothetical protein KBD61_05815 [Patescibacteria group bacterium]|nr:hypothetical protein [Patescibacteria group bacterium]MBP9710505.1 hypothetical protein [Patescibacteria group bacterium]
MVYYRVALFVPHAQTNAVREAMKTAYASAENKKPFFSFSSVGVGRVVSNEGKEEELKGERIECMCPKNALPNLLAAIVEVYPKAESMIEVTELSSWPPYTVG